MKKIFLILIVILFSSSAFAIMINTNALKKNLFYMVQ